VRRALRDAMAPGALLHGVRAVVLGGGGSARAASLALLMDGARVCLAVRSRRKIRDFATRHGIPMFPLDPKTFSLLAPGVIVNATPVGMAATGESGEPATDCLLRVEDVAPQSLVLDLVYAPVETVLLQRARAAGAVPVSGLSVFLHQALEQARLMLGEPLALPGPSELSLLLGPEGRALRAFPPCRPS
jgi:shikimate 5-dehydrogenase